MKLDSIRKMAVLCCISIFILLAPASGVGELTRISEHVYSYVDVKWETPGNRFGANAGIVIGDDAVLVVETLTNAKEAAQLIRDIQKVTDKPIRYAVNTHAHLDHAWGNSALADHGALIIGHTLCRERILTSGEKEMQNAGMYGLTPEAMAGTRAVAPALAFSWELVLDLGNRPVRLIYPGNPSHTPDSIMVHVPGEDVLFTGDIVFANCHPYLAEGDLKNWLKALDYILAMNPRKIIPGHGPLALSKDITGLKKYLVVFDRHARRLCGKYKDPEKIVAEILPLLPKKATGEPIVMMNIQAKYLPEAASH